MQWIQWVAQKVRGKNGGYQVKGNRERGDSIEVGEVDFS
jgi:hypothetical protein